MLARDSFMDILARFIHLQVEEKKVGEKKVRKETMVFPRFGFQTWEDEKTLLNATTVIAFVSKRIGRCSQMGRIS